MHRRVLFYLTALIITGSLCLGGGTRAGFLSDAVLQFVSIPLLLVGLWRLFAMPLPKQTQLALLFCFAVVLVPLIQLIPLPPWLWTSLPNRQPSAEAFELVGRALTWMPISVSPNATWLTALSLVPPIGIFIATLLLTNHDRRLLSLVILSVGVLGAFLGLAQFAQGPSSTLRFFEFTNPTEAVGFFANRNHFAALLYSLMLFSAAWAIETGAAMGIDRRFVGTTSILMVAGCLVTLFVLIAAEAMARSRAGLGLTIVALLGALALAFSDSRTRSAVTPAKLMIGAMCVAAVFALQFALYRILERFASDPLEDGRISFARNTVEAAWAYMPFGSGLGTFVPVYAMFEKPQYAMVNAYANHAHNDILELWLETGVLGIGLMALFAIWFVFRSIDTWRHGRPHGVRDIDTSLAQAATVVIALLIAHSFVDYPLRTGAMMAVMAFACGLSIRPPVGAESADRVQEARASEVNTVVAGRSGAVSIKGSPTAAHPKTTLEATSRRPAGWTAANIEWPEAWRQPTQQDSSSSKSHRSGSDKSSSDEST
jgi:O-antigen ligase